MHCTMELTGLILTAICLGMSSVVVGNEVNKHQDLLAGRPSSVSDASLPCLKDLAKKFGIWIGSASNAKHIHDDKEYDQVLAEQFSITTPENACKWTTIRPNEATFNFTNCDYVVATAQGNNQTIRGHNLCWGAHNPAWLDKFDNNSTALRSLLITHISTVGKHYAGHMYSWDVVNEAVLDSPPKNGTYLKTNTWYPAVPDYIDLAFKTTHEADSSVKLFYNDYNCEVINAKSDAIYKMLKTMMANSVPLHGFGIQAHFSISHADARHAKKRLSGGHKFASSVPTDWSTVEDNIKRFVDLGLEVSSSHHRNGCQYSIQLTAVSGSAGRCVQEYAQSLLEVRTKVQIF
eukprot:scpid71667/ scgid10707/ Endo-1,4-beta-xylanase Z; 1,4-beta-D-xylan xylanohydrolase Z